MNDSPEVVSSADELDESEMCFCAYDVDDHFFADDNEDDGPIGVKVRPAAPEDERDRCIDAHGATTARSPGEKCEDKRCVLDH